MNQTTNNKAYTYEHYHRNFRIKSPSGKVIGVAFTKYEALKRVYLLNGWEWDEEKMRERCK